MQTLVVLVCINILVSDENLGCASVILALIQDLGIYFVFSTSIWCGTIWYSCCRGNCKQHIEASGASIMWSRVEATNGAMLGPGSSTAPSIHRNCWTTTRDVCCSKSGQGDQIKDAGARLHFRRQSFSLFLGVIHTCMLYSGIRVSVWFIPSHGLGSVNFIYWTLVGGCDDNWQLVLRRKKSVLYIWNCE